VLGHIRYHLGGLPGAVRHDAGGLQLLPGDAALRGLLQTLLVE
jgi:hypothetical protein